MDDSFSRLDLANGYGMDPDQRAVGPLVRNKTRVIIPQPLKKSRTAFGIASLMAPDGRKDRYRQAGACKVIGKLKNVHGWSNSVSPPEASDFSACVGAA